jgi:hypothetical protein
MQRYHRLPEVPQTTIKLCAAFAHLENALEKDLGTISTYLLDVKHNFVGGVFS